MQKYVLDEAAPGAIILLHDAEDVLNCPASQWDYLPATIDALRARGYGFGVVAPSATANPLNEGSPAVVVAPAVAWVVTQVIRRLPESTRARQVGRTADDHVDLAVEVDPEYDHIRGPDDAPVTLLEYGDFECPYCGQAERAIRELLASHGDDVRYVWRHLPLNDVHPRAQLASEAAEAAV